MTRATTLAAAEKVPTDRALALRMALRQRGRARAKPAAGRVVRLLLVGRCALAILLGRRVDYGDSERVFTVAAWDVRTWGRDRGRGGFDYVRLATRRGLWDLSYSLGRSRDIRPEA